MKYFLFISATRDVYKSIREKIKFFLYHIKCIYQQQTRKKVRTKLLNNNVLVSRCASLVSINYLQKHYKLSKKRFFDSKDYLKRTAFKQVLFKTKRCKFEALANNDKCFKEK